MIQPSKGQPDPGAADAIESASQRQFDRQAPSILDIVDEVFADVPIEEWELLPRDLSINLDHYLYGVPKTAE